MADAACRFLTQRGLTTYQGTVETSQSQIRFTWNVGRPITGTWSLKEGGYVVISTRTGTNTLSRAAFATSNAVNSRARPDERRTREN